MNHLEHCPICGREVVRESHKLPDGLSYFWGNFRCPIHGLLRIGGTIRGEEHIATHFHPACTLHGPDHVATVIHKEAWVCLYPTCNRKILLERGHFRTMDLRNPAPITMDAFASESREAAHG